MLRQIDISNKVNKRNQIKEMLMAQLNITNETLQEFLEDQSKRDCTNFGYLLIPKDARLNEEARSYIKADFEIFCNKKQEQG